MFYRFKCTVVGPMCLIPCVEENSPIPNLPYPMYSTAMKVCNLPYPMYSTAMKVCNLPYPM